MNTARRRELARLACLAAGMAGLPRQGAAQTAQNTAQALVSAPSTALKLLRETRAAGPLPPGWQHQTLSGITPNTWALVDDPSGDVVVQVDSSKSASSIIHPVTARFARARRLRWRWRSDALIPGPSPTTRAGDDFAARVYVMFDYPLDRVPTGQRWLLRLARSLYGDSVPAAALCYVRDTRMPAQSLFESAYTSRVRMIVARHAGRLDEWFDESRNLPEDFQRAFGAEFGPGIPPISAIALAADTDQTGNRVSTRFADVTLDDLPGD